MANKRTVHEEHAGNQSNEKREGHDYSGERVPYTVPVEALTSNVLQGC